MTNMRYLILLGILSVSCKHEIIQKSQIGIIVNNPAIVAKEVCSENVFSGDLVFTEDDDFDSTAKYTKVTGDLVIKKYDRNVDLKLFSCLEEIGGSVRITDNENIENLVGLERVEHVGGGIYIKYNDNLRTLDVFKNLKSVGKEIKISTKGKMTAISGFSSLKTVPYIQVYGKNLAEIRGFEALELVERIFKVQSGRDIEIARFDNIREIRSFVIRDDSLKLKHFPKLKKCRVFNISNIKENSTIVGAEQLEDVDVIHIRDTKLTAVDGFNNVSKVKHLNIVNNPKLVAINGFTKLARVTNGMKIARSPNLVEYFGLRNLKRVGKYSWAVPKNNKLQKSTGISSVTPCIVWDGRKHGLIWFETHRTNTKEIVNGFYDVRWVKAYYQEIENGKIDIESAIELPIAGYQNMNEPGGSATFSNPIFFKGEIVMIWEKNCKYYLGSWNTKGEVVNKPYELDYQDRCDHTDFYLIDLESTSNLMYFATPAGNYGMIIRTINSNRELENKVTISCDYGHFEALGLQNVWEDMVWHLGCSANVYVREIGCVTNYRFCQKKNMTKSGDISIIRLEAIGKKAIIEYEIDKGNKRTKYIKIINSHGKTNTFRKKKTTRQLKWEKDGLQLQIKTKDGRSYRFKYQEEDRIILSEETMDRIGRRYNISGYHTYAIRKEYLLMVWLDKEGKIEIEKITDIAE